MCSIINDGQALNHSCISTTVEYKIHGPDFVGSAKTCEWLAFTHRTLLAFTLAHLQLGISIKSLDTLVIDHKAALTQLEIDQCQSGIDGGDVRATESMNAKLYCDPVHSGNAGCAHS